MKGILFLCAAITAAIVFPALILWAIWGKNLEPFSFSYLATKLLIGVFLFIAIGGTIGWSLDAKKLKMTRHSFFVICWGSIGTAIIASILINIALHSLVYLLRKMHFGSAFLITTSIEFLLILLIYCMAVMCLKKWNAKT